MKIKEKLRGTRELLEEVGGLGMDVALQEKMLEEIQAKIGTLAHVWPWRGRRARLLSSSRASKRSMGA